MKWLYKIGLPLYAQWTLLYLLMVAFAKLCEPMGWWPFIMVDYLPVVVLVAPVLLVAIVYGICRWPRPAWILGLSGLICLVCWTDWIPFRPQPSSYRGAIRLVTWNTKWNGGLAEVPALLKREHPDVICLQEVMAEGRTDPLWETLRKQGWYVVQQRQYAVISRFPVQMTGLNPNMMAVELRIDKTRLRITTAHLWLPYNLLAKTPRQYQRSIWPMSWYRNKQVDAILQGDLLPDIVCGDMNTPPHTALWSRFTARYQDSHLAGGVDTGMTYPSQLPIIRIDHVFLAPRLKVLKSRAMHLPGSDHRAVMVEFLLNR